MRKKLFSLLLMAISLCLGGNVWAYSGATTNSGSAVASIEKGDVTYYYATLNAAFSDAQANDAIYQLSDVTVTACIEVNKNLTLHMFGKTLTNQINTNRVFRVYNSKFVIVGNEAGTTENAKMIIDNDNTSTPLGFVDLRNSSNNSMGNEKLEVYNVDFEGATTMGSFINARKDGQSIKLQDVNAKMTKSNPLKTGVIGSTTYNVGDNMSIVNCYNNEVQLEIIRGKYEYDSYKTSSGVFQAGDFINTVSQYSYVDPTIINMQNVEVVSTVGPVIESHGTATYTNCKMGTTFDKNSYLQTGLALAYENKATINSGEYYGNYGAYIYNSGGTMDIYGGTFKGTSGAVKADATSGNAVVNIMGGKFDGKVYAYANDNYSQYSTTITITAGTFENVSFTKQGTNASIVITGGTFDANPAAYVVEGYNIDSEVIGGKTWYTVSNSQAPADEKQNISWNTAEDWATNNVPTSSTNVSIPTDITVTVATGTVAQANSVTLTDNSTLIVKDGATLIVGNGGVTESTTGGQPTIIVEEGGKLYISPDAEVQHPYGSMKYTTKAHVDASYLNGHVWEHIAIPTVTKPSISASTAGVMAYLNTWDIVNGWTAISFTNFDTPFQGYNFSNDNATAGITYTFTGNLVGNQVNTLAFAREGYTFFGNSYSAPINIKSMLQSFSDGVQRGVYIYDPENENFDVITVDNAGKYAGFGKTYPSEIQPMQGFFIYCPATSSEEVNYENAVWNFAIGGAAAPARQETEDNGMAIMLTSANGRSDMVSLRESDERTQTLKMNSASTGVSLYAVAEEGNMSNFASGDLDNVALGLTTNSATSYTLNFDNVEGDYVLCDMMTGAQVTIMNGIEYNFYASANATIDTRFVVRKANRIVTGMDNIEAQQKHTGIYSVTGMYIGETSVLNTLPSGVYVVDGVKVVK